MTDQQTRRHHSTRLARRGGERQLANPSLGLAHNLGGVPYQGIAAISILGLL